MTELNVGDIVFCPNVTEVYPDIEHSVWMKTYADDGTVMLYSTLIGKILYPEEEGTEWFATVEAMESR